MPHEIVEQCNGTIINWVGLLDWINRVGFEELIPRGYVLHVHNRKPFRPSVAQRMSLLTLGMVGIQPRSKSVALFVSVTKVDDYPSGGYTELFKGRSDFSSQIIFDRHPAEKL